MIVVVGGGITGLALGRRLEEAGEDFVILEASSRVGGVIRSAEVSGRVLDWGPQRTRLAPPMAALIEDLDLADELVTAPKGLDLFVYRAGKLRVVPFDVGAFLRSDIVSVGAKLRMLAEPLRAGPDPRERVSTFFRRKLGNEIYESIVAPLYGGLYASDPDDMEVGLSLAHVLRELGIGRSLLLPLLRRGGRVTPPPACSFRDGMETLPRALADALGDRVRLSMPVTELERCGAGWRVHTEGEGGAETFDARQVVLATSAPAAADLLRPVAAGASEVIDGLRYNPLGVVHLDAETDLKGLGFQVSFTERDRALRGVTFNDSLFARENVYTAYLGGALRPDVARLSSSALAEVAVREFRDTTGYVAEPLAAEHEWVPAWDVSWRGLSEIALPDGLIVTGSWWSRPGLPGRLGEAARVAAGLTSAAGKDRAGKGGPTAPDPYGMDGLGNRPTVRSRPREAASAAEEG
ncbi:MAG: protoporphyrinogen oxidase [Gemmatimonadota bacterium]